MALVLSTSKKVNHLYGNLYAFNVAHYGTGTAGGTPNSVTDDLSDYVRPDDIVTLKNIRIHTSDTTPPKVFLSMIATNWSALDPGTGDGLIMPLFIAGTSQPMILFSGAYGATINNLCVPLPLLLGRKLVSTTLTLLTQFDTNTDTKSYNVTYQFLIERNPS